MMCLVKFQIRLIILCI